MKRAILAAFTCCAFAGGAIGADTAPPKKAVTPAMKTAPAATTPKSAPNTAKSKTAASTVAKGQKSVIGKGTPTKSGARTAATRRYYGRQSTPARRSYTAQQLSPTPDRYREIQDALAAKGYLKTPPTGVWDKDSMDAMSRFQQDQKLDPTGKLTARSLVALGLGPKPPAESAPVNSAVHASGEATPLQ